MIECPWQFEILDTGERDGLRGSPLEPVSKRNLLCSAGDRFTM